MTESRSDEVAGLARVAASAWWHTTGWALRTSARGGRRLAQAAASPESAGALARDVQTVASRYARALADLGNVPERGPARSASTHPTGEGETEVQSPSANGSPEARALRDLGEELLRKSRDVRFEEDAHPAYERILSELAPDEGRILLLMLTKGPQPAVDVRTGGPLGLLRSRLIAPGLSMIGDRAGARHTDRVPSYLHNLFRLGLIWFSRETIQDPLRYQVLEAQPPVLEAIHSVRQAKVVRRSIHLTPFGEDFCRACLPVDDEQQAILPAHDAPYEPAKATEPPKV